MLPSALILGFYLLMLVAGASQEPSVPVVQQEDVPNMDEILNRMKDYDEWQERYLVEYRAQRKFRAENLRFKEDATLEVMTTFRRPDTLESQVLRAEGSKLIRERVFNKILEAENEIQSKSARGQVDIVPANYSFIYLGTAACADRKCYRLGITPRRQEKYLIQGEIWVDAEDWGIVRVQGSPSKRPSFWTRKIQIDRRFKRIDGMWLNASLESISDILIAGRSTLNIEYSYEAVQTDGTMDRAQYRQSVYLPSHQVALNGRGKYGGTQEATAPSVKHRILVPLRWIGFEVRMHTRHAYAAITQECYRSTKSQRLVHLSSRNVSESLHKSN